jgi:predicted PhzF superfamily epimerase YddE/YHI9
LNGIPKVGLPGPPSSHRTPGEQSQDLQKSGFPTDRLALRWHAPLSKAPDLAAIGRLDRSGVIVTAPGDESYDFVSRYFAPAKGIPEDPVTGGAHCALVPYWAHRLGKLEFRAFQA